MGSKTKLSNFERRVDWLVLHAPQWYRPEEKKVRCSQDLVKLLKADGLVAQSTYWCDVRMAPELAAARKLLEGASNGKQ